MRSTPAMPWCAAQCTALRPPTWPRAAAPAARSCSAQRRCPPARAASSGVVPCESAALGSALRRSRAWTTCACPASAAGKRSRVHCWPAPCARGLVHAHTRPSAMQARARCTRLGGRAISRPAVPTCSREQRRGAVLCPAVHLCPCIQQQLGHPPVPAGSCIVQRGGLLAGQSLQARIWKQGPWCGPIDMVLTVLPKSYEKFVCSSRRGACRQLRLSLTSTFAPRASSSWAAP